MMKNIELWHKRARPEPDEAALQVQLGCHIEEIVEMFDALDIHYSWAALADELSLLATRLKQGETIVTIKDREAFLDSLADQIVTAVGVGHCAKMRTAEAVEEVNRSNWSKFDQETGQPMFSPYGKIVKGPNYRAPNLKEFI